MTKTVKYIFWVSGSLVSAFILFLLTISLTAYRPSEILPLENIGESPLLYETIPQELTITSWNIGYGGLGFESDFVLDGGKMGKPESRDQVEKNLKGIAETLDSFNSDILLLQEVDTKSNRSFGINQVERITALRPGYHAWFARNYKALFIPYPLNSPLGRVNSGILTLSRFSAESSQRLQLPGNYSWPVKLFYPVRCAQVTRFPAESGERDWYIINVHLSAYDKGGNLRIQQLKYLRELMLKLYNEGHYVIAGGDWNSLFPGSDLKDFGEYTTGEDDLFWIQSIPESWTPEGWQWGIDSSIATCRTLEKPYVKGENLNVVIDGFLLSPNLELKGVKGLDLNFQNSDHNPVTLTVKTK